jgi:hypothetical protein
MSGKPQFDVIRLAQYGNYEGYPLSPPVGEAAQGECPLTPPFGLFSSTILKRISNWGCQSGGGRSPKKASVIFVFFYRAKHSAIFIKNLTSSKYEENVSRCYNTC